MYDKTIVALEHTTPKTVFREGYEGGDWFHR